ncbi:hypothetical protein BABINDRAFT_162448, partial [Babjeviella inositovora NRRL Y-12698]
METPPAEISSRLPQVYNLFIAWVLDDVFCFVSHRCLTIDTTQKRSRYRVMFRSRPYRFWNQSAVGNRIFVGNWALSGLWTSDGQVV